MFSTPVIAAIAWAVLLGGAGGLLTEIGAWYRNLRKPSWQPPDWLFGPAWTIILGLAAWAAVLAWNGTQTDGDRAIVIALYAANFVFHLLWSPLFFKFKRPDWALIEVALLWLSIAGLIVYCGRFSKLSAWLLLPYIAWVSVAAALN